MKTRTDKISYRSAHVDARLTLREAHSLGTVLAAVEGDGGREQQARAFGLGLLEVARTLSPGAAELIAEMVACNADPRTETGKTALALCDGPDRGGGFAGDPARIPGRRHTHGRPGIMLKATLESTLTGIADAVTLGLAQEPANQVLLGIRERLQAMPYRDVRNRVSLIRDRLRRDTDQLVLLTGDEPEGMTNRQANGREQSRTDAKVAKEMA